MRNRIILPVLVLVLILGWNLSVDAQKEDAKSAPSDPARIQGLIQKLGSSTYIIREQSARELEAIGPAALPSLRQAARSGDIEISRRARELVNKVEEKVLVDGMLT